MVPLCEPRRISPPSAPRHQRQRFHIPCEHPARQSQSLPKGKAHGGDTHLCWSDGAAQTEATARERDAQTNFEKSICRWGGKEPRPGRSLTGRMNYSARAAWLYKRWKEGISKGASLCRVVRQQAKTGEKTIAARRAASAAGYALSEQHEM